MKQGVDNQRKGLQGLGKIRRKDSAGPVQPEEIDCEFLKANNAPMLGLKQTIEDLLTKKLGNQLAYAGKDIDVKMITRCSELVVQPWQNELIALGSRPNVASVQIIYFRISFLLACLEAVPLVNSDAQSQMLRSLQGALSLAQKCAEQLSESARFQDEFNFLLELFHEIKGTDGSRSQQYSVVLAATHAKVQSLEVENLAVRRVLAESHLGIAQGDGIGSIREKLELFVDRVVESEAERVRCAKAIETAGAANKVLRDELSATQEKIEELKAQLEEANRIQSESLRVQTPPSEGPPIDPPLQEPHPRAARKL